MIGFDEYRAEWLKRHPNSVPDKQRIALPYPVWLSGGIALMFFGAVLLSAVHTIPTMYDAIPVSEVIGEVVRRAAAHASVFVIELSLLIAVYASSGSKSWLSIYTVIEFVAFVGALAANLHSVLSTVGDDSGARLVGIVVGSLPPLVGALSGAVYARMRRANLRAQQEADAAYKEALKTLDAVILAAYRKVEKEVSAVLSAQTDAAQTRQLSASVLSEQTADRQTLRSPSGYNRTPDGQQRVIDYLTQRPEDAALSSRDLALRIEEVTGKKIGHDTANKGRNAWSRARAVEPSANGSGGE